MTNAGLSAKVAEARGDRKLSMHMPMKEGVDYYTRPDGIRVPLFHHIEKWTPKPYATDMNAAWELVELATTWEMHRDAHNLSEVVVVLVFNMVPYKGIAKTQCRAICKAYIAWRESEND